MNEIEIKYAHIQAMKQKNNKLFYQRHKEYFKTKYDDIKNKLYCECCNVYFSTNFNQQKHIKTIKHAKNMNVK